MRSNTVTLAVEAGPPPPPPPPSPPSYVDVHFAASGQTIKAPFMGPGYATYQVSGLTAADYQGYSTYSQAWIPDIQYVELPDGTIAKGFGIIPPGVLQTGPSSPPKSFQIALTL